jgi:shikimate kinase
MAYIIAALPGVGITTTVNKLNSDKRLSAIEVQMPESVGLQSSSAILVQNVLALVKQHEYVFIPPTVDAINALIDEGIALNVIYPHAETLESHIQAMRDRGVDDEEIQLTLSFWDQFQSTFEAYTHPANRLTKLRLPKDRALDQVFDAVRKHLVIAK